MGYISLQFNKAKGTSDSRMSDHIERKTIPSNADSTRTHLNRELIGEGVKLETVTMLLPSASSQQVSSGKLLPTKYELSASCFRVHTRT